MDLRQFFSRASSKSAPLKNNRDQFFLAVKVSSSAVLATVWHIEDGQVSIGNIGSAQIQGGEFQDLLKACDQAVSQASIRSAPDVEKVIFAVPHSWVTDGKIVPEHLTTLRRICKELDLIPLGYVVTTEALENFYKEVEGAPLTAILIGIDEDRSILTLFRAGKELGSTALSVDSSSPDQISPAIEAALRRFPHVETLPSRIILYNSGTDLEPISQKITAYSWTGKLPFLHFPKVEKAPADFVIKAVAAAGGIQMGASFNAQEFLQTAPSQPNVNQSSAPSKEELNASTSMEESTIPELEEVSPAQAGFVTESDFVEINIPSSKPTPPPLSSKETSPAKISPPVKKSTLINFKDIFKKLPNLNLLLAPLSFFRISSLPRVPIILPAVIIGILILVSALLFTVTYFIPKATLLVTVNSKSFNHQLPVVISTEGITNEDEKSLPGSFLTVSEIGTRKGVTTGEKTVGDKAKGSVTIYSVSDPKTFPASSVITAANGLKFTLDQEVKVASGDAVTPATIAVSVHAADIGDKYNLQSGTKFTIGNFSSNEYLAKNDTAFTGGNSHLATIVTKADQDRLLASLSAELTEQAKADLQSKVNSDQTLLPNAITSSVSKKKFSKEIDAESDSISLDLTMDFQGIVFSRDEAVKLFETEFSSDIPPGYILNTQNAVVEVNNASTDKQGKTTLVLIVRSNLTPELNTAQIVSQISGKSFTDASDYMSKLPGVSQVHLEVKPDFFESAIRMFLPWKKNNIKIEVITQ